MTEIVTVNVKLSDFERCNADLDRLEDENAKLCELILDMLVDEERGHNDDDTYYEHVRLAKELGIEV
jgi:hypothetical protein